MKINKKIKFIIPVAVATVVAASICLPFIKDVNAEVTSASTSTEGFSLPKVTGAYNINANVGTDPKELDFAWFTQAPGKTQIKISRTSDMNGTQFPSSANIQDAEQTVVKVTQSINQVTTVLGDIKGKANPESDGDNVYNGKSTLGTPTGEYSNKATIKGLTPNTQYSYSVSDEQGNWSPVYTITTLSTDKVSFAAFGDPQIGAFDNSKGTAKSNATGGHKDLNDDKTAWQNMLKLVSQNKDLNFLFTMGDQVNDYNYLIQPSNSSDGQWYQYRDFFNPDSSVNYMQNIPLAEFSGNHDHQMGEYYGYHYNQPNISALGATQYGNDGDYWFTAGPVLFLVLNANNYGTADHDQFIAEAIKANPNVKWKVATWHQSAYSEANHNTKNEIDDPVLTIRNTWTKMMDKYNIDVVLQGHDHYYTRTAQMLNGNVVDPSTGTPETLKNSSNASAPGTTNPNATYATKEYPNSVTNPKGTVYFTLDSGTGSKFYDLNSGSNDTIGGATDHSFSVVGWQGYVPSYSYVSFTNDTFTIKTYAAGDYTIANQTLIDSYTITKN
ncbi:metallophosphoesterase family protein [Clostridium sp.]|uniref:metallophosphoesterase family protein n=1 Tax=Clostridium sp. TaxID=1506 RepID=UPI00284D7D4F|nr:metallophosphoesterase family protein [Clostridium sp.]MDR3594852.1 metallophosphoesterase family protein [Clostridium sp.]